MYLSIMPVLVLLIASCCSDDNSGGTSNNFDRQAMLVIWADHLIIPAYRAFQTKMTALKSASDIFVQTPTEANLLILRQEWQAAYIAWQSVSMFEIGPAEDMQYRGFMNIYPTDATSIENSIASGTYSLVSVSTQDEQGFPAIDYLINGLSDVSDSEIVNFYTSNANAAGYKAYLNDVITKMNTLTTQVISDWQGSYRNTFVSNSGSSASSTVDRFVNDYIFYYEKALRAGKIGIPAGVFSNNILPGNVEAYYKADLSKQLFNTALNAVQDFFNGKHFNSNTTGASLKSYLDFLNTIKNGEDLSTLINNQFDATRSSAINLSTNCANQVQNNNTQMLATYDQLQANVVLLKVDMLQALDINVDFVDADGD